MGDVPLPQDKSSRGATGEGTSRSRKHSGVNENQLPPGTNPQGPSQFTEQLQPMHQTLQTGGVEYYPGPHVFIPPGSQGRWPTGLNMSDRSSALPSHTIPFGQQAVPQPFIPQHQSQGLIYPMQQLPFPAQPTGGATAYSMPYPPTFHPVYTQHQHLSFQHGALGYQPYPQPPQAHQGTTLPGQAHFYGSPYYPQQQYTTAFGPHQTMESPPIPQQSEVEYYDREVAITPILAVSRKNSEKRDPAAVYDISQTIVDGSSPVKPAKPQPNRADSTQRRPTTSPMSSTPRGPPRKPKQSGHALWVGNLPPSANVEDLKDHFSRDTTNGIESVFLISRSNCAFVNYKTETACNAAMTRFHDSRFQGVRLVCRLRRGLMAPGSGSNVAAMSMIQSSSRTDEEGKSPMMEDDAAYDSARPDDDAQKRMPSPSSRVPERFFIVKSLTVEDLELSRQSGIWATQTHNEANLNKAYETADNVYLIFSANKSGEYFGYARMVSPIHDDEALMLEMPARPEYPPTDSGSFNVTPTAATATAPKGRIIADTARGTIFWEADSSEDDQDGSASDKSVEETVDEIPGPGSQSFGKPFKIEWISTERVPFHRTRGLRNPWNANREVKIARDGTEIEPSIGRKLTQLFHLSQPQAIPVEMPPPAGCY